MRISSLCGGGDCVEVGRLEDGTIALRYSALSAGTDSIVFTQREWAAFVAGVKAGEFGSL